MSPRIAFAGALALLFSASGCSLFINTTNCTHDSDCPKGDFCDANGLCEAYATSSSGSGSASTSSSGSSSSSSTTSSSSSTTSTGSSSGSSGSSSGSGSVSSASSSGSSGSSSSGSGVTSGSSGSTGGSSTTGGTSSGDPCAGQADGAHCGPSNSCSHGHCICSVDLIPTTFDPICLDIQGSQTDCATGSPVPGQDGLRPPLRSQFVTVSNGVEDRLTGLTWDFATGDSTYCVANQGGLAPAPWALGLVDDGFYGPALPRDAGFPNFSDSYPLAGTDLGLKTYDGTVQTISQGTVVLCVYPPSATCGEPAPGFRFVDAGSGYALDSQTGLTWDVTPRETTSEWPRALADCADAGMELPTIKELGTIAAFSSSTEGVLGPLQHTSECGWWSSTPAPDFGTNIDILFFNASTTIDKRPMHNSTCAAAVHCVK